MKRLTLLLLLLPGMTLAQVSFRGHKFVLTRPGSTTTAPLSNTTTSVTVLVTYVSAPVAPTATTADLKYNKKLAFCLVKDDGGVGDYQVLNPVINGGTGNDGITYSPRRYSDGTSKLIDWHYTFALNWNNGQLTNPTSSSAHKAIVDRGFVDISNHSLTHVGYYNRLYDIQQNQVNIYNYFGYRTRNVTVPTSYEGFVEPALDLIKLSGFKAYKLIASQGYGQSGLSSDDNNSTGNKNVIYGERVKANETRRLITTRRYLQDGWTNADLPVQKAWVDTAYNASYGANANTKFMFQAFSHGPSYNSIADTNQRNNYIRFLDYIQNHPKNNNSIWLAGLQEFHEYLEMKQTVSKTQSVKDNVQTIVLDYSGIDPDTRWRDLSLLISGGAISSITVLGADDFSYNSATGLVNIYKKKTSGFSDPSTDPAPPQLVNVGAYGSDSTTINLTFDRPVSQSVVAGWSVYNSSYAPANRNPPNLGTPIPITSLTGSGTRWQLHLSSPASVSTVVDYRLQRGNALDASTGQKVSSYIGYPLSWNTGSAASSEQKTLSVMVYGLTATTISINGVKQSGTQFVYPAGTVLSSVTATVAGKTVTILPYTSSASSYTNVLMDADKVLRFYANL